MDAAPGGTAIVQIKIVGDLLDYPRGKSAMVWYGVVIGCEPFALEGVVEAVQRDHPERDLVWRYARSDDAEGQLKQLLTRFRARFGARPGGADS